MTKASLFPSTRLSYPFTQVVLSLLDKSCARTQGVLGAFLSKLRNSRLGGRDGPPEFPLQQRSRENPLRNFIPSPPFFKPHILKKVGRKWRRRKGSKRMKKKQQTRAHERMLRNEDNQGFFSLLRIKLNASTRVVDFYLDHRSLCNSKTARSRGTFKLSQGDILLFSTVPRTLCYC